MSTCMTSDATHFNVINIYIIDVQAQNLVVEDNYLDVEDLSRFASTHLIT